MRRLTFAAIALVVLATAGLAVAKGVEKTRSMTSVGGTFAAGDVQPRGKVRTCTTSDGKTLVMTNARYTGTASGGEHLTGAITIDARSVVDTTDGLGVVRGKLRIDGASGAGTNARFTAVYAGGKLVGLATGHVQGPHAALYANLSADFNAETGFSSGKLGAADGGSAVAVGPGKCAPSHDHGADGKQGHKDKKSKHDDDD